jgi:hypothetical protein
LLISTAVGELVNKIVFAICKIFHKFTVIKSDNRIFMKKNADIQKEFEVNGGVLSTKELQAAGIGYYQLNKLVRARKVEKIRQGLYRWCDFVGDDLVEFAKLVPAGVMCLYSAAAYHELTTFISAESHIAIAAKRKIQLPDFPLIQLYYWKGEQLERGKLKVYQDSETPIWIYDKEKVVCDFLKFRNKTGLDLMKEVLGNYLKQEGRNISKLMEYAKPLRVESVLKTYLEVLL